MQVINLRKYGVLTTFYPNAFYEFATLDDGVAAAQTTNAAVPAPPPPPATEVAHTVYLPLLAQPDGLVSPSDLGRTTITKYYYFNGQRIAMRQNGVLTYLHSDHLGSTVLTTDSSGNTVGDERYYAYGRDRGPNSVPTDHRFTGQKQDGTGLMYYGARYYDPQIGTFVSPDTLVPDPTHVFDYNRYMYARGNPIKYNDPTGHCPVCVVLLLAAVGFGVEGSVAEGPAGGYADVPTNSNGQLAAAALAGDVNDLVTVATGYDHIWHEPVPYFSPAWSATAGMAALPLISGSALRAIDGVADAGGDLARQVDNLPGNPCAFNSFSADTPVMTAAGLKPISELVEGELVLAYNEATAQVEVHPITATISHEDPAILLLTLDGETLKTTAEHPFYAVETAPWLPVGQSAGRWTAANDLQVGDLVRQADGTTGTVQAVTVVTAPQRMYNLTVAVAHTFFVGQQQWLVHNANCNFSTSKLQHEWKHASDFGLSGSWNKANGELFQKTLENFIDGAPQQITGTFRGTIAVTHYFDPATDLWVAVDTTGNYVASWKLGPNQVADLLAKGNVQ